MESTLESTPRTRARAAAAVGDLEALLEMLTGTDWRARQEAAFALTQMGPQVVEPLLDVLANSELSWEARGHAAWVLRRIGDPRAQAGLLEALNDDDGHVRGYAAHALGRLGDSRCVQPLIDAYHRDEETYCHSRHWIVQALGEIGDPSARAFLETVAESDPDPGVRITAQRALKALDGSETP